MSQPEQKSSETVSSAVESRRAFLRKSLYAAYATPVITALLVNKASAASSWGTKTGSKTPPPPPPPTAG